MTDAKDLLLTSIPFKFEGSQMLNHIIQQNKLGFLTLQKKVPPTIY